MALSKEAKAEVVSQVAELLDSSRLTVMAKYSGTSVKALQQLRRDSSTDGTTVKIVKNRLFKKALEQNNKFKDIDEDLFSGQLLYAFNSQDEAAPARNLAAFAKTQPQIEFIGAINADGEVLSPDDVKVLASLPTKEQLRAQLMGTISAPLSGFVNVMAGNVRGLLNALNARVEQVN